MRLSIPKDNRSVQTSSTLKRNLASEAQLLKSLLWNTSSFSIVVTTITLAIVLPKPACAEAQSSALQAASNPTLQLKSLSDLAANQTERKAATPTTDFSRPDTVLQPVTTLAPKPAAAQLMPRLKQAAPSQPANSIESIDQFTLQSTTDSSQALDFRESISPSDRLAQADPPSEPAEPDSDPISDATPEPSNRWQFSVEPYFFAPFNVQADVTAAGRSASLDLGLDDVLNLDRAFDAGLRVEARRDRLGFIFDAFYVSAAQSGTAGVTLPEGSLQRFGLNTAVRVDGDVSLAIDQLTIDTAVSYRVIDTVLSDSTSDSNSTAYPRLVVAPIAGLRTRFQWQELEIDSVQIGNFSLPVDREYSASETTIEPLLGTQIGLDLSKWWTINFRGDVSGFNLNADQDFTWNLFVGTEYHFSPTLSLQLAYRFNGFDYEDGEGLRRTRLNLYQNGLWLSGIVRF